MHDIDFASSSEGKSSFTATPTEPARYTSMRLSESWALELLGSKRSVGSFTTQELDSLAPRFQTTEEAPIFAAIDFETASSDTCNIARASQTVEMRMSGNDACPPLTKTVVFDNKYNAVTEFGGAVFDTWDVMDGTPTPPGQGASNWMKFITSTNLQVSEYLHIWGPQGKVVRPTGHDYGCRPKFLRRNGPPWISKLAHKIRPEVFAFGSSRTIELAELRAELIAWLESKLYRRLPHNVGKTRKIYILSWDDNLEWKVFQRLDLLGWCQERGITFIDVQQFRPFQRFFGDSFKHSLGDVLDTLGINPCFIKKDGSAVSLLHNAGNDARLELEAFLRVNFMASHKFRSYVNGQPLSPRTLDFQRSQVEANIRDYYHRKTEKTKSQRLDAHRPSKKGECDLNEAAFTAH